ncbi:MAG: hypothetical protein M1822_005244 [Bathelium mastoideum]|nr:MAG: hypothetical protein M1822_005244 [Bathelium mastoideum]
MASTSNKPTLAFFGATGGCAGSALALALKAGHTVRALARTPAKLTKLLRETYHISESSINSHLTIIEGPIADQNAVRNVLANGKLVDIVIFGIGGAPKFNNSLRAPFTIDNPHVCADGMQAVVEALDALENDLQGKAVKGKKPLVVAISTTGISRKKNDLPMMMKPLYHLLAVPHEDKRAMEDILASAKHGSKGQGKKPFGEIVIIRPSLLLDSEPKGLGKVKVGWEELVEDSAGESKPAVGYSITRVDVGAWIFSEIIEKDTRVQWGDRAVTLTY